MIKIFSKTYISKGTLLALCTLIALPKVIVLLWGMLILGFEAVAYTKLTIALIKEPENGQLFFQRATLRLNYDNLEGALSDLNQSVNLLSEAEISTGNRAQIYIKRGKTYEDIATSRFAEDCYETKRDYYHRALADYEKASQLYAAAKIHAGVSSSETSLKRVRREVTVLELILNSQQKYQEASSICKR